MDMMKAGIALCRCHPLFLFVSVKRSEQEHWDEHSQEYPRTQLPLMIQFSHK